jgi:hypothetical protein
MTEGGRMTDKVHPVEGEKTFDNWETIEAIFAGSCEESQEANGSASCSRPRLVDKDSSRGRG